MKVFIAIICSIMLLGCNSSAENKRYITESSGNINTISVVSDNMLWEGNVGSAIRSVFAAPSYGLPQDEPLFTIRQIPQQVFDGFATKNRLILKVSQSDSSSLNIYRNVYAKPQTVVDLRATSSQELITILNNNSEKIIDAFTKEEVKEKLRRINKSPLDVSEMEKALGFTIDIPSAYRIAKNTEDFFWVRKSLSNTKTMDLMFYEVPLETIRPGDSTIMDIIKMRDAVIRKNIPGPEPGASMTTEDAYVPSMFETIIDNKRTIETRGVWEVTGFFMAGPFLNYAIEDKINNRYLVAEGYVYAPSLEKRDLVFELEAIMKSIEIN